MSRKNLYERELAAREYLYFYFQFQKPDIYQKSIKYHTVPRHRYNYTKVDEDCSAGSQTSRWRKRQKSSWGITYLN